MKKINNLYYLFLFKFTLKKSRFYSNEQFTIVANDLNNLNFLNILSKNMNFRILIFLSDMKTYLIYKELFNNNPNILLFDSEINFEKKLLSLKLENKDNIKIMNFDEIKAKYNLNKIDLMFIDNHSDFNSLINYLCETEFITIIDSIIISKKILITKVNKHLFKKSHKSFKYIFPKYFFWFKLLN